MNNVPITIPTVLLGAANLLRLRGRIVGTTEAPDGRMCLVGAISRMIDDQQIADPVVCANLLDDAVNQLMRTIWQADPDRGQPHATAWNDRICATDAEAIAMLERAAGTSR
jgi:hypothetical protein